MSLRQIPVDQRASSIAIAQMVIEYARENRLELPGYLPSHHLVACQKACRTARARDRAFASPAAIEVCATSLMEFGFPYPLGRKMGLAMLGLEEVGG